MSDLPEFEDRLWDVIVVGTGMGGGTLGYALAQAGKSVLYVEKGMDTRPRNPQAIRGEYPDDQPSFRRLPFDQQLRKLMRAGRCIDEMEDAAQPKKGLFRPIIGGGVGGSSAMYGMVCERLFPQDFTPRQHFHDVGNSTLPESWPISFDELRPYYAAAERLYRVRGTADPLRPHDADSPLMPPPPFTPGSAELYDHFTAHGLHPYALHMACETLPECQTCQGFLCGRTCKNDAASCCVGPAVERHGAALLTEATALELDADRTAVRQLVVQHQGRRLTLRGKHFALACGGLATPLVLLNSKNAHWPQGLANDSDMVGRNFMRHAIDFMMLQAKTTPVVRGQAKELSFTDFYLGAQGNGEKLGAIQSLGPLPPIEMVLNQPAFRGLRPFRPLLLWMWRKMMKRALIVAAIMEDLPYRENRVTPRGTTTTDGRQRMQVEYRHFASEERRLAVFRGEFQRIMAAYKPVMLRSAADNSAVPHVCGTCRFGDDPKSSVLDRDNRAHGLDNLYVVDASFFPSSGGINPSLTIAANALRVADHLTQRLG